MSREHRFIVCRKGRAPVFWQPPAPTDQTGHDLAYFGGVLDVASRALANLAPLTFVLTWDVHDLPETGRHVVAIVQGDEDARIPAWSNDVLVTFKCYGIRPHLMPPSPRPGLADALELANFCRRAARWIPGAGRRYWPRGRPWPERAPIYPIPLGYYNQLDRPLVPFAERRWTISFAGSGAPSALTGGALRQRIGTAKDRSRARMWAAVEALARELPDEPIAMVGQPEFPALLPGEDGWARGLAESYSELLGQTRVCLVPRGHSPETFRFFEALRAGCVIVCESLPDHWFYRDAPVITVRTWDELSRRLRPLLADRVALEDLHHRTLRLWERRCSERAIGQMIAARVAALAGCPYPSVTTPRPALSPPAPK
jgi:hypothetical protein